ncbi:MULTISPECIES: DUF4142 domain-containing protein [Leptolyngbya]|uniref:DUF4142 domain-containing protein n=1 Tax=Leptolyngbya boryana NIES-2135 TaxID=1973484 RepID=A0A1Z4JC60_LEPBY|nr:MULTISPECIES: DUF4142 domain-containing protein [Leptolyngbya]BAY54321.1 hypothetical protein NIES2135_11380 [Leptolyngbya boryana NIES-2135]MBD2370812.1 DUF4142 domain-containing protein [Leptolyngbya sp. FACHB-161]MBD2377190.1 DUF4142 domain-containing protein [Leptolyngbya sp. FACHB-238]MBD2401600.1 DUF4142 domain-containing protein [Leptolyngbya sp. FACHB-239]MBD2408153.1 DUF4142 domain-containing protein [Leptolyngbya sp. FACHB-402]
MKKYLVLAFCAIVGLCFAFGSSLFSLQATAQTPRVPATPARQVNLIDVAFVNEAAQSGLGNIMLGELALQKSKNQAVQQFAQAEIKEQQGVKANLTQIAPQIGVTLPTATSAKFQAAMARLSQLSGTQFDNAYLDEGGVNAHLEVAALFQREAAFGRNPDLINVVTNGLPIINQHFTTASRLTNYQFAQVARRYNETQNTSAR